MLQLMVVDDHLLYREAIVQLLQQQHDFRVVGQFDNGADVVYALNSQEADIVLMDLSLKGMNGIDATRLVKQQKPDCKVVVVSMHGDSSEVARAFVEGADGYVLKEEAFRVLLDAINSVKKGQRFVSPSLNYQLTVKQQPSLGDKENLSPREKELVALIANGHSSKQIANQLGITVRTVEKHRTNLYRKLGIKNNVDLTRYAIRNGFIRL